LGAPRAFDDYPSVMNSAQVAELLLIPSVQTVRRMAQEGRIPAYRSASQWQFDRDELLAWLRSDATRVKPADE